MNFRFNLFQKLSKDDKTLRKELSNILGFKPKYMPFYVAALTHRSANTSNVLNNERLEFLGDAFIGSCVGDYLFKKYPTQDEGYLTEMRSKIVSRQSLNAIAIKMGLQRLVKYNQQDRILKRSHIFGNALEALVGAIYLDYGYKTTNAFIYKKLIGTFVDIDELEQTDYNFKNKIYTWAQKNHYNLEFNTIKESYEAGRKIFTVGLYVNNQLFIEATGYSKKEASQTASHKALEQIDENPNLEFSFQEKDISDLESLLPLTLTTSKDELNVANIDELNTTASNKIVLPSEHLSEEMFEQQDIIQDAINIADDIENASLEETNSDNSTSTSDINEKENNNNSTSEIEL